MQNATALRQKNAVLGALVADAASMGFHWLYDPERIRQLCPHTPEFREPSINDFEGAAGYFAHASKQAGDLSQYGDQALVMLRSLVASNGHYIKAHYESQFCDHFGYGGEYIGYIDRPTRDTLNNVTWAERQALERSRSIPFDGDEGTRNTMITKVLACVKQFQGTELAQKLDAAVRETHNDDTLANYAQAIADEMQSITGFHGANDDQLPALAKLPALVALYAGKAELPELVESAVRVTNNNDLAVQFGLATAAILEASLAGTDIETAIATGCADAAAEVQALVNKALSLQDQDNAAVTDKFGKACSLVYGVPSLAHNLVTASSFTEAVRRNIYAGGDSCGRAIPLGAVLGATYGLGGDKGIPEQWVSRLRHCNHVKQLLEQLYH